MAKEIQRRGIETSLLSFAVTCGGFVRTARISICWNLNPFARKPPLPPLHRLARRTAVCSLKERKLSISQIGSSQKVKPGRLNQR